MVKSDSYWDEMPDDGTYVLISAASTIAMHSCEATTVNGLRCPAVLGCAKLICSRPVSCVLRLSHSEGDEISSDEDATSGRIAVREDEL